MKRAMRRRKTWQRQTAAITAAMMAMSVGGIAYAMPQGEVIRSGKGEITRQDKDMTVNQDSKRLAIDWAGFDIANDERVTFRQPDRDSVALNRVVGDAASVIDGALSGMSMSSTRTVCCSARTPALTSAHSSLRRRGSATAT